MEINIGGFHMIIALAIFVGLTQFWVLYLSVMNLKRNRAKLTTTAKVFAYPMIAVGLVIDVSFNLTIGAILFLELPQFDRLLFTDRLSYHINDNNWRASISKWFCSNFLSPFDPSGAHCGEND